MLATVSDAPTGSGLFRRVDGGVESIFDVPPELLAELLAAPLCEVGAAWPRAALVAAGGVQPAMATPAMASVTTV